jgi:hypothetical protein
MMQLAHVTSYDCLILGYQIILQASGTIGRTTI